MKVCLKNISKSNLSDSIDVIKDFCQLLQDELKLKKDVHIHFENERNENMTTGVPEDEPIQDIGGPEENMASVLSSVFLKKFQKQFPQHIKKIFGE